MSHNTRHLGFFFYSVFCLMQYWREEFIADGEVFILICSRGSDSIRKVHKYLALVLLAAFLFTSFLFTSNYYIISQLAETQKRIAACNNVILYVEILGDNINKLEGLSVTSKPLNDSIVKSDIKLINLIDRSTRLYELDIDYMYIAGLKNYYKQLLSLHSTDSQLLPLYKSVDIYSSEFSVNDCLYQVFAGAQRSSVTLHSNKSYVSKLVQYSSSATLYAAGFSAFIFILLAALVIINAIRSRSLRSYATISTDPIS